MIQTLKCKKCSNPIKIDYSKAPKDEFIIGCPSCNQKYKLKKPQPSKEIISSTVDKEVSTNIKNIPCPKCNSNLGVDLSKIIKFPAIISCKKCSTKLKINDPNIKSTLSQNKLDSLQKGTAQVKIDVSKIDTKNNRAYKLYFLTRSVPYLNKLTLFIYLSYLSKSISKKISEISITEIDQESFVKLKAETKIITSNIFNFIVNPILKENGIPPNLLTWATSWFVKKVSLRTILIILDKKGVNKNLPFIKKYIDEVEKDNNKIIAFVSNQYLILIYFVFLILVPLSFYDFYFDSWLSALLNSFIWGGLPLLLANYKGYLRTKNVFIGNLAFWLLVIIIPHNPESSFLHYARETFDTISTYYVYFFTTISLTAILLDFMQSKGRNIDKLNKLKIVYKPIFLALSIVIPFLCLTLFSSITKHKVTDEELEVFTEKNTNFQGNWFFLNSDSTIVNNIYLSCDTKISSDENGDIDLTITASFDERNSIKLNKYESKLEIKENYNFELKYPIRFENLFEVISYDNDVLKAIVSSSKGEIMKITALRDEYSFLEIIRKKEERLVLLNNQSNVEEIVQ